MFFFFFFYFLAELPVLDRAVNKNASSSSILNLIRSRFTTDSNKYPTNLFKTTVTLNSSSVLRQISKQRKKFAQPLTIQKVNELKRYSNCISRLHSSPNVKKKKEISNV